MEQSNGEANLVSIVMRELGLGLQDAVDRIGQWTRDAMDEFVAVKATLPSWDPDTDEQVGMYLRTMEHAMIGLMHWSLNSRRYFGDDVDEVRRTLSVTLLPRKNGSAERS